MATLRKVLKLLFIGIFAAVTANNSNNCFTSHNTHGCRLSTMTPYRLIGNKNDSRLHFSDCEPKKIWLMIRHGTRFPGKKWTARMMKKLPQIWDSIMKSHSMGKGSLSDESVENLRHWKFTFSSQDVSDLAKEGGNELVDIAERFQSRFPSIMPEIYNNQTYTFKYTATQRTEESAKNFALGLFGRKQSLNVWYPEAEHKDPILRFYKRCKRWRRDVEENPGSKIEQEKFTKSSTANELVDQVSSRVGFKLDYDTVRLIYLICAFETAWNDEHFSPWCHLLTLNNFKTVLFNDRDKVFEYEKDLQHYWKDGYGYSVTYEQACNTMKDIFEFFESNDEVKTKVYFTHSGTVLKMIALLGLAKDEKPLRHDFFGYADNRAWRTSLIDSFASNIAFILYDCAKQGPSVLFMHQERIVQLDDCPQDVPCPLSTMKRKYPDHAAECPFDEMCEN